MAKYRLLQNDAMPGVWAVEVLNAEGTTEAAFFEGPNADQRAAEYAAFKNKELPFQKKVEAPVPPPVVSVPEPKVFSTGPSFTIQVINDKSRTGHEYELLIYPNELDWTYDQRRGRLTAKRKDPIEILRKKDKGEK